MNFDHWLSVLGVSIGLIGVLLACYFYVKTIRTKVLAIAYTKPIPLILPMKEISVSYLGTTQTTLSRVFVLLWNKGTSPIESSDFIGPIAVQGEEKVLLLKIYDKDAAANSVVNTKDKTITVNLLRPGEAIILQIDAADEAYRPDLSVQMKASDMSVLLRLHRGNIPFFLFILMTGLTVSVGFWGLVESIEYPFLVIAHAAVRRAGPAGKDNPFKVRRMASSAPMAFRRAVSMTDLTSA